MPGTDPAFGSRHHRIPSGHDERVQDASHPLESPYQQPWSPADDPNLFWVVNFDTVSEVMMGDIVQTDDAEITLTLEVSSLSPIERVEV